MNKVDLYSLGLRAALHNKVNGSFDTLALANKIWVDLREYMSDGLHRYSIHRAIKVTIKK